MPEKIQEKTKHTLSRLDEYKNYQYHLYLKISNYSLQWPNKWFSQVSSVLGPSRRVCDSVRPDGT